MDLSFLSVLLPMLFRGLKVTIYIAEIVRGSLDSIDPGQKEAGLSLGLTPMQTMIHLIIPPAFRSMLPSVSRRFRLIRQARFSMLC